MRPEIEDDVPAEPALRDRLKALVIDNPDLVCLLDSADEEDLIRVRDALRKEGLFDG